MNKGLKVTKVNVNSLGKQLGILEDDLLVSYNNKEISTSIDLSNAMFLAKEKGANNVDIVLLRDEKELRMSAAPEPLGIVCEEVTIAAQSPSAILRDKGKIKTQYTVAHGISSIITWLGWALVLIGGIAAVMALFGGSRFGGFSVVAMMPGIGMVVGGFALIMGAEVTKATVDSADHTREILRVLRDRP